MTKFKNIEFLRFIFSLIIIHYHTYSSMSSVPNVTFYRTMADAVRDGYIIVEMFFIMSGFFLGRNYQSPTSPGWTSFALDKVIRLWPLAVFIWTFGILAYQTPKTSYTAFMNLFFLQSTGIVLNYRLSGIMWFVSALFWVLLFYYYLLKNFEQKKADLWIALIVFFSYVAIINYNHGNMGSAGGPVIGGIFNMGILRSLAGVGLGYFLSRLYNQLSSRSLSAAKGAFTLFSLIEAACFVFVLANTTVRHISYDNKFIFVLVFSWLMLSFCLRLGVISRLLENSFSEKLGRYAYSIYVTQIILFYLCSRTLWKIDAVLDHPLLNLGLILAAALGIGIAGYHLIEAPARKLLYRRLIKNERYNGVLQRCFVRALKTKKGMKPNRKCSDLLLSGMV